MALWIQDTQRAVIKKSKEGSEPNLTHKEKFSTANLSTSRSKGNGETGYLYSDWGFARFVGKAYKFALENLKDGDVIVLNKAIMTKEPYNDGDGNRKYPSNPTLVIFECSLYNSQKKQTETAEVPPEDDIPF